MLGRRTITNFTAVVVVAAVLLVYGLTQLVARAVLDPTYQLYAELPAGGGLFEDKQVTYRGNAVGTVREVILRVVRRARCDRRHCWLGERCF